MCRRSEVVIGWDGLMNINSISNIPPQKPILNIRCINAHDKQRHSMLDSRMERALRELEHDGSMYILMWPLGGYTPRPVSNEICAPSAPPCILRWYMDPDPSHISRAPCS